MRRSKISFWLLSLAFTFVSAKAAALPILVNVDEYMRGDIVLGKQRACVDRSLCSVVQIAPDMPFVIPVEEPMLERPLIVPPLLNQPIAFVDDIVVIDGGPGGVTRIGSKDRPVSVPEPGTLVLLAIGLFGFTMRRLGSS